MIAMLKKMTAELSQANFSKVTKFYDEKLKM